PRLRRGADRQWRRPGGGRRGDPGLPRRRRARPAAALTSIPDAIDEGREAMSASVSLSAVAKTFVPGARPVLDDINLEITPGETVTVIGPSGSGKSTLLNCIAGMEPYSGAITIDGEPVRKPRPGVAM